MITAVRGDYPREGWVVHRNEKTVLWIATCNDMVSILPGKTLSGNRGHVEMIDCEGFEYMVVERVERVGQIAEVMFFGCDCDSDSQRRTPFVRSPARDAKKRLSG